MTTAIIGATGQLGREICRRISSRDDILVGYYRNQEVATQLQQELSNGSRKIAIQQVDLKSQQSVKEFLQSAYSINGTLTSVLSAEGANFPVTTIAECDPDAMQNMLATDVMGSLYLLKHAHPLLKQSGGGSILLFTTSAIIRTLEDDTMNSAPKSAVAMMIRQAAREMGVDNIRVNGVAPGVINTQYVNETTELPPHIARMVERCQDNTPMARNGHAYEVADLCDFLCSDRSTYVSGQIVAVDGGYSA